MKIVEIKDRTDELLACLFCIWKASALATHSFLSVSELEEIAPYVKPALKAVPHLAAAYAGDGEPAAFIGVDGQRVEMLFVKPELRGKKIGKTLLEYAFSKYGACEVAVNEQNLQATGFYEHMGFCVYKRCECDEQGRPYPLLYMRKASADK